MSKFSQMMDKHKLFAVRVIFACIAISHARLSMATKTRNATKTDLSECKLTQFGSEYRGPKSTTGGGIRCQFWHSEEPLHKISSDIKDSDLPERSMRLAKNYCRNPTKDPKGPWCYTTEPTLIDDVCGIPLCNFGECRISGTGAEYGGARKTSVSGKRCKSWNKRHKLAEGRTDKFSSKNFPELSREKAESFCRNPNDDTGGPWCYVEEENYETVEKEYCDVAFCDDKDCLVYARNASVYSTVTKLNETYGNVTFWVKLWNPMDEQHGEARLLLSLVPVPTSAKRISQDWKAGVEIVISNAGTGQVYPTAEDEQDLESTPNIILGSKWTGFWINWGGGFVSVGIHGSAKPLFLDEYKKKNSISSLYPESFLYYGLMGTGVLWSTEFCQETCEVHTTFGMEFLRVWPLQPSNTTYDVRFNVRASQGIAIRLYQSPGALFPCFTVTVGDADTITLVYQASDKSTKQHLKDAPGKSLLDYWKWKDFTLSIFGPHLRLFSERIYGNEEVLYAKDNLFGTVRWFSVGSRNNIALWTFFCSPDASPVEDPAPPNCISNLADYRYEGSQWTSLNEMPCIPWTSPEIPDDDRRDDLFVEGSALKAINKCRNPGHDPKGPYCYSISLENSLTASKQYCPIRSCRSSECRMAGTANDYIGTLSTTRSGRSCAEWLSDYDLDRLEKAKIARDKELGITQSTEVIVKETEPSTASTPSTRFTPKVLVSFTRPKIHLWTRPTKNRMFSFTRIPSKLKNARWMGAVSRKKEKLMKPIHDVNPEYFNDTLYPEHSARNASNYCRDPSRNIAGTWCYTTDPLVPQDLCDVRDCEMPEECTFLVKGHGVGRRLYVLPEHRAEGLHFSLKAWEPDRPDSITFVFTADDGLKSRYILKVGALGNEKVLLYYQGEEGVIEMVKKKTLPHLLYLGKWSSFVIKIPRGKVLVYYQGAPNPLFQWDHPEPEKAFLPIYYYYTSELGYTIGVAFDCATRCHIENTQTDRFTRILPLSIWSKSGASSPNRLELMIRAEGVVLIPLLLLPATPGYYALTLGELGQWVFFLKNTYPNVRIFHKQKAPTALFTSHSWTNFTIIWFNHTINVLWNGSQVFHYEHTSPMIFYYFSLAVDRGGWATWAANCIPSDIDGDPEDGGWSEWGPWACSASCNGGVGTRKRVCNNPEPNVKGEPCLGPSIMSGRCNTIACGDITEDTVSLIKRRIRRNHTALSVKEGHEITIPSDPDIIRAITTDSPDSDIEWSHNGIFVHPDDDRIEIEEHNIVIKRAEVNDSGVYTITLHRVDGTHMIFKMVTLVVYPVKSVVTIRETLPMTVTCHCVVLGYLYSDLKISWTIGQDLWKDYGTTLPISVNVDIVPDLNVSHKGLWECIVEQDDLGFKWTTNAILVNVIGPPNWRTHLMEDKLTRPIFGWMPNETFVAVSALIIFLIISACIVVGTGLYTRFQASGKYRGSIGAVNSETTKKPERRSSVTRDAKTVGTQHKEEESYDEKILKSTKGGKRSKIRRSRDLDEKPERRKLILGSDTDTS